MPEIKIDLRPDIAAQLGYEWMGTGNDEAETNIHDGLSKGFSLHIPTVTIGDKIYLRLELSYIVSDLLASRSYEYGDPENSEITKQQASLAVFLGFKFTEFLAIEGCPYITSLGWERLSSNGAFHNNLNKRYPIESSALLQVFKLNIRAGSFSIIDDQLSVGALLSITGAHADQATIVPDPLVGSQQSLSLPGWSGRVAAGVYFTLGSKASPTKQAAAPTSAPAQQNVTTEALIGEMLQSKVVFEDAAQEGNAAVVKAGELAKQVDKVKDKNPDLTLTGNAALELKNLFLSERDRFNALKTRLFYLTQNLNTIQTDSTLGDDQREAAKKAYEACAAAFIKSAESSAQIWFQTFSAIALYDQTASGPIEFVEPNPTNLPVFQRIESSMLEVHYSLILLASPNSVLQKEVSELQRRASASTTQQAEQKKDLGRLVEILNASALRLLKARQLDKQVTEDLTSIEGNSNILENSKEAARKLAKRVAYDLQALENAHMKLHLATLAAHQDYNGAHPDSPIPFTVPASSESNFEVYFNTPSAK